MESSEQLHEWLSLRLVPEMNRTRFYTLLEHFAAPPDVFNSNIKEIASLRGFSAELASAVLASHATDRGKRHLDQMNRAGIRAITRDCADYPENLKNSQLAPPLLFVKGSLQAQDKYAVSLVGSRHATQYGRSVARELAGDLARYGLTIVSGFARGIDGEAHHAAIVAVGRTIAVLGNGLDVCYPSEHQALVDAVAVHGALISEYPLGTPPERYNFPERNHIIAALSLGTIVVEAAEKSGSLITSRLALDENRFVFAVPGDITRNNSRGANNLIKNGACMVQRAADVLVEMKDVLRGYLNVDAIQAAVSGVAAPKPAMAAPAPLATEPLETATAPPAASPAAADPASTFVDRRARRQPDWADAITALDHAELEKLAAKLDLDTVPAIAEFLPDAPPDPPVHEDLSTASTQIVPLRDHPQQSAEATVNPLDEQTLAPVTHRPAAAQMQAPALPALSDDEQFIVALLYHEPLVFDEIAHRAFERGIDVPRLTTMLMKLEMRKVIRQLPGRYYLLFV